MKPEIFNKQVSTIKSTEDFAPLIDYLTIFKIDRFFDLENENEIKLLTDDYNSFANTKISEDVFYTNAIRILKIINKPKFSFFKKPISNIYPYKNVTLTDVFELIKSPIHYGEQTLELRNINNKAESSMFKCLNFDYVTFSGMFSRRNENSLIKHSNLIVLDFDNVEKPAELKTELISDKSINPLLVFISPGGNGIKIITKIDIDKYSHLIYFNGLMSYFNKKYQLKIDPSGKDISRACFLCHDPEVYINPQIKTPWIN